jgi:hypothetical protein
MAGGLGAALRQLGAVGDQLQAAELQLEVVQVRCRPAAMAACCPVINLHYISLFLSPGKAEENCKHDGR